ncbi:hypothetical protein BJY01DRAFT_65332 [Aspergillus pseudoustus]|uniref:Uncharacterized protein n=1 Tax=Aspergillus pseudoustus TaxID=1810923 RepID=A0ABR4KMJ2_9EURO
MSATYLFSSLVGSVLVAQAAAQFGYDDPNDIESINAAGASGVSSGGGMSTGGMIALCVIVGVVVILGFSSAALFYLAKKNQWRMREKLRRSARQVGQALKTPLTPRFPRSQRPYPRDRDRIPREAVRAKPQRLPTDVEKDAVLTTDEASKNSDTKPRGWSSYFSFNRS